MKSFYVQSKAELLRTLRNRRFFIASVALPLAFYLFFVSTMGNQSVGGTTFSAYYMISMAVFGVMGGAIQTLSVRYAQEKAQGWVKMLQTTPLSPGSYIASKIVSQMILSAMIIAVIFLVGGLAEGVNLPAGVWLKSALWIWVGGLPFMVLGILIGTLSGKSGVQVVSSGIYLIMAMLGGLWMPVEIFSKTLRSIAEWTPTYRFAHVVWNIVGGKSVDLADMFVLLAYLILFMVLSMLINKRQEAVNA